MSDEEEVEVNPRPIHRTPVLYPSRAPDGESWAEYFRNLMGASTLESEEEDAEDAFEVVVVGLPVSEEALTATQKRILRVARALGLDVRMNRSVVRYADKFQKNDGKPKKDGTQVMAGDLVKPAHCVCNLFMSGVYPNSLLRFDAAWKGSPQKFSAHISDPIGRWAMDEEISWRETTWMETGVKAFEAWLKEWVEMASKKGRP